MPPLAFTSSTARRVPLTVYAPASALGPVVSLTSPILMGSAPSAGRLRTAASDAAVALRAGCRIFPPKGGVPAGLLVGCRLQIEVNAGGALRLTRDLLATRRVMLCRDATGVKSAARGTGD